MLRRRIIFGIVFAFAILLTGYSGTAQTQVLEDYQNQGRECFDRSDFQSALEEWGQGLEVAEQMHNPEAKGAFLCNLGVVYRNIGDFPKALTCFEQALQIRRQIPDSEGVGMDLSNIGLVYQDLGDYSRALSNDEQALKIHRQTSDLKRQGDDFTSLGNVYLELGDFSNALHYYEQASKINRDVGNRKGEAINLNNRGLVYRDLNDYSKACDCYKQALDIFTDLGLASEIGQTRANLGDVYLERGEFKEAWAIFRQLDWAERLGRFYLRIGDYPSAREEFSRDLQTNEGPRNARLLLADYIGLGRALEELKDYALAKGYYQKAVEFIEHQRETLGASQRRDFFAGRVMGFSRLEPYEGLARISLARGDVNGCFFYSEHCKSRVFLDVISQRYGGGTLRLPQELSRQEDELTNRIASLYKQQEAVFKKDNRERYKEIEEELEGLKEEQQKFITSLRMKYPEYASLRYPRPMGLDEIALRDDELLLEYEVTDKETMALLVGKGRILKAISIPISRDSLTELVKRYRSFTQAQTFSDLFNFDPVLGTELYDLLIKGFVPYLNKEQKLIVIPDEILDILPFEMLVSEKPERVEMVSGTCGPYPKGVRYLGDDYPISYYQSATSLTSIRSAKKSAAKRPLFAVADPIFDSTDTRIADKSRLSRRDDYQLSQLRGVTEDWGQNGADDLVFFPRLKRTGEVVQRLKQSFGKGVKVLTGFAASENRVKKEKLDQYDYLLFATHGILDNTIPYVKEPALVLSLVETKAGVSASDILSGIWNFIKSIFTWLGLLSKEPSPPEAGGEDLTPGFLTLSEVMDMKIGGEVAALTACNTGVGKNLTGEGVMGLGRAFQYAGAKTVLISLWNVEDESTNLLTEHFFGYLKEGKDKLEALRQARTDLRQAGYENPYYWSAFILVGER
jgi:CHAT domain-containing protein